jgi:hypothetical protein
MDLESSLLRWEAPVGIPGETIVVAAALLVAATNHIEVAVVVLGRDNRESRRGCRSSAAMPTGRMGSHGEAIWTLVARVRRSMSSCRISNRMASTMT